MLTTTSVPFPSARTRAGAGRLRAGREVDVLMIGGGASSLSLVLALLDRGYRGSIGIVEPRTEYRRDRTWCFWDVDGRSVESLATRRWSQWCVGKGEDTALHASSSYSYLHIPADAFYHHALSRIDGAPNVELLRGHPVDSLQREGDSWIARTRETEVVGSLVIDSRPPAATGGLVQSFRGFSVQADRAVFDPEVVRLMDFIDVPEHPIAFIYGLPFSRSHALIEATVIGPDRARPDVLTREVDAYLSRRFPGTGFRVVYEEAGAIPMRSIKDAGSAGGPTSSSEPIRIGLGGGMARPSTGYAFLNIQRDSDAIARSIVRGENPVDRHLPSLRARFLDRIFIQYLANNPDCGRRVFRRLFQKAPTDDLVRFLSDSGSIVEDWRIISALPKMPFLRELFRASGRTS